MVRRRSTVPVIALALAAIALVGCGTDESRQGPPFHPGNIQGPRSLLLSRDDVRGIGASSPYGVVLRWWRALQAGNAQALKRNYAGHVTTRAGRRQIRDFRLRYAQPVVPTVDEQGGQATVDVIVRAAVPLGDVPHVVGIHDFPASFDLVRRPSGWKLRPTSFGRYHRALLDALLES